MKFLLASVLSLMCAFSANATLISINNGAAEAQTLDISGQATSFVDFYNYNNGIRYSSNTGYEIVGQVVVLITELNDELGIFTLTRGGFAALDVDLTSTAGQVSFVEESNELINPMQLSFKFYGKRGDGFIFSDLSTTESFKLDFDFFNLQNISQYSVLDFRAGSSSVIAQGNLLDGLTLSVTRPAVADINAPSALLLMLLAGGFLLRRKK